MACTTRWLDSTGCSGLNILIEIPAWLGDCVMATAAIESLLAAHPDAQVTAVGAPASCQLFAEHPRVGRVVADTTKENTLRLLGMWRLGRELGRHDLALSFRSHLYSRLLLGLTGSPRRHVYRREGLQGHQVEKYQIFVNKVAGVDEAPGDLRICFAPARYERPTLGINPGATYGSAKRWYPDRFAEVSSALSRSYDIVIFGGPTERGIADDIEAHIRGMGVGNVANLAGKTSIKELCERIGGLDLFITGDSGPMHIAAAYKVPTVAIFGPTRHEVTSPWNNERSIIVRHDLECAPCMERECPLGHHDCMKLIASGEVLAAVLRLEKGNTAEA